MDFSAGKTVHLAIRVVEDLRQGIFKENHDKTVLNLFVVSLPVFLSENGEMGLR